MIKGLKVYWGQGQGPERLLRMPSWQHSGPTSVAQLQLQVPGCRLMAKRHGELDGQNTMTLYVGRTNTRPIVPRARYFFFFKRLVGIFFIPMIPLPWYFATGGDAFALFYEAKTKKAWKMCHCEMLPIPRALLCPGGPLFTRLRSVPGSHDLGTFANSSGCGGMLGLTWCVGMFGWFWYIGYLGMFGSSWFYWKGSGVRERDWQASCDTIFASFGSIDIVIKRQIISSPYTPEI